MEFTTHAIRRCNLRAIPRALAELIVKTGDVYNCGQSWRIIISRSKNAHKELVKELQIIGIKIKYSWENTYVVIDGKGMIITAGHRKKRIKKMKYWGSK